MVKGLQIYRVYVYVWLATVIIILCSYFENDPAIPIYCNDAPSYLVETILRLIFEVPISKVCSRQPVGVTRTSTFFVDATKLSHRDDVRSDDLGVWKNVGVKSTYCSVLFDENNKVQNVMKFSSKPLVLRSSIYRVKRSYWCHAQDKQFFRRLIELEGIIYS